MYFTPCHFPATPPCYGTRHEFGVPAVGLRSVVDSKEGLCCSVGRRFSVSERAIHNNQGGFVVRPIASMGEVGLGGGVEWPGGSGGY